jgi:murein DD-endopeptidase MepM/ murein hydrolase activator NlpD
VIGYMGSTGGSFGTHLHFEVWAGGDWQPVNPYAYL